MYISGFVGGHTEVRTEQANSGRDLPRLGNNPKSLLMRYLRRPPGDCGSLVGSDTKTLAGDLQFIDLRAYGGISVQFVAPGLMYGDQLFGGTLQQYFDRFGTDNVAMVLTGSGNTYRNIILLGSNYYADNTTVPQMQKALFHEFLHRYYRKGDVDLAKRLGLGDFDSFPDASRAIIGFVEHDCIKD